MKYNELAQNREKRDLNGDFNGTVGSTAGQFCIIVTDTKLGIISSVTIRLVGRQANV